MKLKRLLIIFAIFLVSGCSANYDLNINSDNSVSEYARISVDNTQEAYDNIQLFLDNNLISKKDYTISRVNDFIIVKYKKKYENLEDYIINSVLYKQLYNDVDMDRNLETTKINTSHNFSNKHFGINNDNSPKFEELQINIKTKLPFISNNADEVSNNKYTWKIDENTKIKTINFEYRNRSSFVTYKSIIIVLISLISSLIIFFIIYNRFKESQRF